MPTTIDIGRATVAFAIASAVPFLVASALDPQLPTGGLLGLGMLAIVYGVVLCAIAGIGFPVLFLMLKQAWPPLLSSLVVGLFSGILLTFLIYRQGFAAAELFGTTLSAMATAFTAALVYFRAPWRRRQDPPRGFR